MEQQTVRIVPSKAKALMRVFELANELTKAIDMAAEDIGGYRPIKTILRELGPACDDAETAIRLSGTTRQARAAKREAAG